MSSNLTHILRSGDAPFRYNEIKWGYMITCSLIKSVFSIICPRLWRNCQTQRSNNRLPVAHFTHTNGLYNGFLRCDNKQRIGIIFLGTG